MEELKVLDKYKSIIRDFDPIKPMGKVLQVNGMAILSEGPPNISIGDLCRIDRDGKSLTCEVTGFEGHKLILMPLGPTTGIYPGAHVLSTGKKMMFPISQSMLGRVFDGMGNPLDMRPPVVSDNMLLPDRDPPLPTQRIQIHETVETGIKALDGLLTIGRGQRMGIFAGTGVGKSTLLGMIARYSKADINIICLVGERGREVREFLENDLGDGLSKSIVIAATNDRSAMEKVYAPGFATSIAEYFRDKGLHVNLLMDSVTRYCMALRETGIASGEHIGPGGYPPGVWFRLSRLLERSGALAHGSITGFYTVLVEADDMNEPVADNTRGFLDGHIVLSRRLAQKNHYPSIEVTESISRVMDKIVPPEHLADAQRIRTLLAAHKENEDLINLGAYARGSNGDVDEAIDKMPAINAFLKQKIEEGIHLDDTQSQIYSLVHSGDEESFY